MRIAAEKALIGSSWQHNVAITTEHGNITAIEPATAEDKLQAGILVPGFIDVQVNGGGGTLFNYDQSPAGLDNIFQAHAKYGTTAMLPTLITDNLEVMQRAADGMAEAIANNQQGILGIHYEGPHLSVPKRGVHNDQLIRELSQKEMDVFCRKDLGIKVLTLAPENVDTDTIHELVKNDVIVCLGHTNTDYDTTMAALEAGATGFTHLFNAMSALTSREPGVVGAALDHLESYCGIIADGHHLHWACLRLAQRVKREKLMLVTDAMSPVGSEETRFELMGDVVTREGDRLTATEGQLAGSVLDMASAVRLSVDAGIDLDEAVRMASLYPATFLGLQQTIGTIELGKRADFVVLNENLNVMSSWVGGNNVFKKQ